MKRIISLFFIVILSGLILSSCANSKKVDLNGTYTIITSQESDEMMVETIVITDSTLTMMSGSASQEMEYCINGNTLTIKTILGEFSYDFVFDGEDTILLDGIKYVRKTQQ